MLLSFDFGSFITNQSYCASYLYNLQHAILECLHVNQGIVVAMVMPQIVIILVFLN